MEWGRLEDCTNKTVAMAVLYDQLEQHVVYLELRMNGAYLAESGVGE